MQSVRAARVALVCRQATTRIHGRSLVSATPVRQLSSDAKQDPTWQPRAVPVGPYMDAGSSEGTPCGLPPPPASPAAATSVSRQGLPAVDEQAVEQRHRDRNVEQLEKDHDQGVVSSQVRIERGIDGVGSTAEEAKQDAAAAAQRVPKTKGSGQRSFSTAATSPPTADVLPTRITPNSSTEDVMAAAASAHLPDRSDPLAPGFNKHSSTYEFTKPEEPVRMTREQQQPQQQQQQHQQHQHQSRHGHADQASSTSSRVASAARSQHSQRPRRGPPSFPLPDLSSLMGTLSSFATGAGGPVSQLSKLATPSNLASLAQLGNPATALSAAARLATRDNVQALGKVAETVARNMPAGQTVVGMVSQVVANIPGAQQQQQQQHRQSDQTQSDGSNPPPPNSPSSGTYGTTSSSSSGSSSGGGSSSFCSSRNAKPTKSRILEEILRVDHAGEYGAQRIYDGQLFVLGAGKKPSAMGTGVHTTSDAGGSASDIIEEMRAQEIVHLRTLEGLLPEYRVRPTALLPLWHVAGFGLGAASALMGTKAAMACTVAVEDVITSHYNEQLRTLNQPGFEGEREQALKAIIRRHRDDEESHKDIGLQHDAEQAPFYQALTTVIQAGCHAAIWVSKRV